MYVNSKKRKKKPERICVTHIKAYKFGMIIGRCRYTVEMFENLFLGKFNVPDRLFDPFQLRELSSKKRKALVNGCRIKMNFPPRRFVLDEAKYNKYMKAVEALICGEMISIGMVTLTRVRESYMFPYVIK